MHLWLKEDLEYVNQGLIDTLDKLRDKKIFLTGGTGFFGKSLLETLLWINYKNNLNIEIFCLSRDPASFIKQSPHFKEFNALRLIQGDIQHEIDMMDIGRIDLTIHAATDVVKKNNSEVILSSCTNGTKNALEISNKRGCEDFLLVSSGAVYGKQAESSVGLSESDALMGLDLMLPSSGYALGKQAAEWLVLQNLGLSPMRIKTARCFAFVGPYLPLDKQFAIGNFIQCALQNKNIEIRGDGTPLRTYLYATDLCIWLLKILLKGKSGGTWNVGGCEIVSIQSLAQIVREELNNSIAINVLSHPNGMIEKYIPNVDLVMTDFGLSQGVDLRNAIKKTAKWSLQHGNI